MKLPPSHVRILELAKKETRLSDVPAELREALADLEAAGWVKVKADSMLDDRLLHLTPRGALHWLEMIGSPETSVSDDAAHLPFSDTEKKVLDVIKAQPSGTGILGRQIVAKLNSQGFPIEQSTLTSHIIPKLKKRCGVKNRRGVGYYCDPT